MKHVLLSFIFLLTSGLAVYAAHPEKTAKHRAQLYAAVQAQNQTALTKLLKKKTCKEVINQPQEDGSTLLHAACKIEYGSPTITRMLVKAGANTRVADTLGRTPLHYAAQMGEPGTVRALLAAGADAEAYDERGKTPLDMARSAGRKELFYILRDHIISLYTQQKILVYRLQKDVRQSQLQAQPPLL